MKPWLRRRWLGLRYPTGVHTWRWRLLGVWLIVFTVIVAYTLQRQGDQSDHSIALAKQNLKTNLRQERTIRLLCDDLYILNGITSAAIQSARLRLADHIKQGQEAQAVADRYTIRNFESYSAAILDQLTRRSSPCVMP